MSSSGQASGGDYEGKRGRLCQGNLVIGVKRGRGVAVIMSTSDVMSNRERLKVYLSLLLPAGSSKTKTRGVLPCRSAR